MGVLHPNTKGPIFTGTKLFLDACDKNFVYSWLNKDTFPNLQTVYLASHPCEPEILNRQFNEFYLHDKYEHYKKRWTLNPNNVKIISNNDYIKELSKYLEEEISFE